MNLKMHNSDMSKEERLNKLEKFKSFIENNEEPNFDKDIDYDTNLLVWRML